MHLTKDDLIEIHRRMIERYGGAHGMLNEGTLDYAVARATRAKDFIEEAAILLETMAKEHHSSMEIRGQLSHPLKRP